MRRRRARAGTVGIVGTPATVCLVLGMVVAGCTASGDGHQTTLVTPTAAPPTAHGPTATMTALIEGKLSISLDPLCIRVVRTGTFPGSMVVWPEGTFIDISAPTRPELVLGNGRRYADGDPISVGGGYVDTSLLENSSVYGHLTLADVCGEDRIFLATG